MRYRRQTASWWRVATSKGRGYDELQVESGLSYAAIANRLKCAKQQMRRRIEKLLGGMAVLPGRTFIWGGIETVKLSVKTKLAMQSGLWQLLELVEEACGITTHRNRIRL